MRHWSMSMKQARGVPARKDATLRLAALTAIVGPPNDAEAQRAFYALRGLFLRGERAGRWRAAIDAIPATRDGVLRIADCVREYGRVADEGRLFKGRYRLDVVVGVMAKVADPAAYVRHAAKTNFLEPGALFHPNTYRAAESRIRGALDRRNEGARAHTDAVESRIKVVRD